jgi:hypothetical protein
MGAEGRMWELVDAYLDGEEGLSQEFLDELVKISHIGMRLVEAVDKVEAYWALDEVDRPRTYGTEWRGGRR